MKRAKLFRTIGDLNRLMKDYGLSPEAVARETSISNMTIRRLIANPFRSLIPERYRLQLSHLEARLRGVSQETNPERTANFGPFPSDGSFDSLLEDLEKQGSKVENFTGLQDELDAKFKDPNLGDSIVSQVKLVFKTALDTMATHQARAVAIGAILYFINPFDLIPDVTPGIGYLDDFGVLSLAIGFISKGVLKRS